MKEKFELSSNQKTLWTALEKQSQGSCYYDLCLELSEGTNEGELKSALKWVLEKHEILASGLWKDESNVFPTQCVRDENAIDFIEIDSAQDVDAFCRASIKQISHSYDPMSDSAIRCCMGKVEPNSIYVYFRIFGFWLDHFGCYYFVKELNAFLKGTHVEKSDEEDMIEYVNFASWQNQTVADPEGDVFWKDYNYTTDKQLVPFGTKGAESTFDAGKKQLVRLDKKQVQKQIEGSNQEIEHFFLSSFISYLNSFGNNELTIGYVPFKPLYEELELTMGAVSKALPLAIDSETITKGINQEVASKLEELLEWSDYFEGAKGKLNYCFEYVHASFGGVQNPCRLIHTESIGQQFDLKLVCTHENDSVDVKLYYDRSVFSEEEITLISAQLTSIFLASNELSEVETQIIKEANGEALPAPGSWSVLQQIQLNVQETPTATALICENRTISYAKLGKLSDQVAFHLTNQYGIQSGDSVALVVERSEWMVISILGILKSGAFYVPIDVNLPEERIQFIVKDAEAKVVLHGDAFSKGDATAQFVHVSDVQKEANVSESSSVLPNNDQVAYCIYTSGTTGLPKGCLLSHANLNHYIHWANEYYYDENDEPANWALITSIAFDLTVTSIFSCLTVGGQLWIGSGDKNIGELLETCLNESTTNSLKLTPSHLLLLNESGVDRSSIQRIILGGEKVVQKQVAQFLKTSPETRIFNEYGPTEATVGSVVEELFLDTETVLIGTPIERMVVRIARPDGTKCRIGETGELLLSGAGVSIGYLGREDLNTSKFFSDDEGRWYKTGDLARWTPGGKIDCLGRIDEQLKIRGYRIEPGEIEFQLASMPAISAAVVLGHVNSFDEKVLVAYYAAEKEIPSIELVNALGHTLPDYMIPSQFIHLKVLPLTTNGKVDKHALPNPEAFAETKQEPYVAPKSSEEKAVTEAYALVLNSEQVGVNDNFFHLGGDSIKAIRVVSELRKSGFATTIEKVLLLPTPVQLSSQLKAMNSTASNELVVGDVLLGPIQKKLLSEEQVETLNYNQAVLLKTTESIDLEIFEKCLVQLTTQHDMLRTRFEKAEHGWKQECLAEIPMKSVLTHYDVKGEESFEQVAEKVQQSIVPTSPSLFKVLLDTNRVLLVAHHLIVDAVSWRILIEDLNELYAGLLKKEEVVLPPKSTSFKEWQKNLAGYGSSDELLGEKAHWENVVEESFAFPEEARIGSNRAAEIINQGFELSELETGHFLRDCYKAYRTEGEILLITALLRSFGKHFTIDGLTMLLEGHGRQSISEEVDVSRTVGWFTSLYPVNFGIQDESVLATLLRVKEQIKRVPGKGFAFGVLESVTNDQLSINPPVTFNYLGEVDALDNSEHFFQLSGEPHGNSISPNWERSNLFDVTVMVVNGKLSAQVAAGGVNLKEEELQVIASSFQEELKALIETLRQEQNEFLTPSDLTLTELDQEAVTELNENHNLEDVYGLSPLQEGMYYHWKMAPDSDVYLNQIAYNRHQTLSTEKVEKAFTKLIERHSVLRTGFTTDYLGKVLQVVRKQVPVDFNYIDNRNGTKSREEYLSEDVSRSFDIDAESLVRLTLVQFSEQDYLFVWAFHHVILDGWCIRILINDFDQYLAGELSGEHVQLPEVRPFSNYIDWLGQQNKSKSTDYWNDYLSGYEDAASVPYQTGKLVQTASSVEIETSLIQGEDFARFNTLCNQLNITQNSFLQTVWGYLLGLYNGSDDVIFGSVVSGRSNDLEGIDEMVGLFINTIPVRCTFEEGKTIEQLLIETNRKSIESTKFHYQNLAEVQSLSEQGMHLIDHIMVFENFALTEQSEASKASTISNIEFTDRTNYPFNLVVIPVEDGLKVEFRYDTGLFEETGMKHLAKEFTYWVNAFAESSDKVPSAVPYPVQNGAESMQEMQHVSWPEDKTIIDCISQQLTKYGGRTALKAGDKEMTYAELERISNQMAWYLIEKKAVQMEDLVSICLERNEWVIISMLATLKAGAAYVPIDPLYPTDRIEFIQQDSGCKTMIDASFVEQFLASQSDFSSECPNVNISPANAAYVIYTSGTTGLPKGVVVEHRNVVRLLKTDQNLFDFDQHDVWTMFHSYCFDFSVWEMYGALFHGGKLVMIPASVSKDLSQFADMIVREKVTVLNQTPSVFELLTNFFVNEHRSHDIRYVIFGGEQLNPVVLSDWKKNYPACRLINMYGITETTVHVTYKELNETDIQSNISNIGRPIPTLGCYVRDKFGREVPTGIPGELFVSGAGVARGYLNREELTKERFTSIDEVRVYRSGDLVRKNHTGELEYLGRNDQQVKIRGYRIETAEIEKILLSHDDVREVRVLVKGEQSRKQLCAYFSSGAEGQNELAVTLRIFLASKLPDYMVPAHFIQIEQIPVTVNGKLDRSKLPEPTREKAIVPLETATEMQLGACWTELLKLESTQVGKDSNFFDLGGNSLTAMRLTLEMKSVFNCDVAIAEVFERQTLAELAEFIDNRLWLADDGEGNVNLTEIEI